MSQTVDALQWDVLLDKLRLVVARRGVENVADAIPVDRATVYRLLSGKTRRPTRAVRAGVERLVSKADED